MADEPDGRNINDGCGSTHLDAVIERTRAGGFEVAFAFDGDGDRVLAVDGAGEVVDGDELVALAALHLHARDRLPGGGVAVTVMTNYGFHTAMREAGVEVAVTAVGDRYVLDELRRRGWALGGEQSGHIIELGFGPSGDGIASALLTLEALDGRDLRDRGAMEKLPQRLVNIRAVGPPVTHLGHGGQRLGRCDRSRAVSALGPRACPGPRLGYRAAHPRHGGGALRARDRRCLQAADGDRQDDPGRRIARTAASGR